MKERCLKNNGRKKAFWGALISAASSLIGTGLSIASSNKAQKDALAQQKKLQQEQLQREQTEHTANTLNNYFNSIEQEPVNDYIYKRGGRRKLSNAGVYIKAGGNAYNIGNNTYLLRGKKHSQKNEAGGHGIEMSDGNTKFEAQDGEVVDRVGNSVRVFSAENMINGKSPAELVMQGKDKDSVFAAQQKRNHNFSISGNSTPVKERKALNGAYFTTPDYIGLGTNIGASLLSGIWGNSSYNDLLDDIEYNIPDYVDEAYIAGPTRWRNAAQRAEVERARLNARKSIVRNTASSSVGLNRMQKVDTDAMYELNKLWDEKANKETEMRQANVARAQEVRARNAAAKNAYYQKVADIRNQQLATKLGIMQSKLNNNIGMIQGIGSSIGGFLQSGIDNYQADQARRMQIAASPYGSAERMASLGVNFSPSLMRTLREDAQTRMNRFETDTSDAGVKSYKDALDSYNFWGNKLGLTSVTPKRKYSITRPNSYGYAPRIYYNPLTGEGGV